MSSRWSAASAPNTWRTRIAAPTNNPFPPPRSVVTPKRGVALGVPLFSDAFLTSFLYPLLATLAGAAIIAFAVWLYRTNAAQRAALRPTCSECGVRWPKWFTVQRPSIENGALRSERTACFRCVGEEIGRPGAEPPSLLRRPIAYLQVRIGAWRARRSALRYLESPQAQRQIHSARRSAKLLEEVESLRRRNY